MSTGDFSGLEAPCTTPFARRRLEAFAEDQGDETPAQSEAASIPGLRCRCERQKLLHRDSLPAAARPSWLTPRLPCPERPRGQVARWFWLGEAPLPPRWDCHCWADAPLPHCPPPGGGRCRDSPHPLLRGRTTQPRREAGGAAAAKCAPDDPRRPQQRLPGAFSQAQQAWQQQQPAQPHCQQQQQQQQLELLLLSWLVRTPAARPTASACCLLSPLPRAADNLFPAKPCRCPVQPAGELATRPATKPATESVVKSVRQAQWQPVLRQVCERRGQAGCSSLASLPPRLGGPP